MANKTANYGLTKPLPSEFYNVEVQNGNMDIIDEQLKKRATLDDTGKVPSNQLPSMDYIPTSEKGKANGVATLGKDGKLPTNLIPDGVGGGKRIARFSVGSSSYGWTASDCDYLCDGTADEVEINAAIQALRSTGGEVVLLDGTYNLTGSILLDGNNITIRGNGNNTKLIRGWMGVYASRGMILINADYCEVKDLYLDGVRGSYNDYYNNGVYFDSLADYGRLEGCMFVNHGGAAVLDNGESTIVTRNWFADNDTGIDLSYGDRNVVSANTFITHDYCIKVGSNGNVIANNTMKTTAYYAIDLSSADNNSIVGNVSDGAKSGLYASYGTNGVIVGNTFNNNTKYGIELSTGATGNTISGNTCIGCTSGELYVYETGNKLYESHTHAASEVSSGTFVGQVVANSSGQTPATKLIRNSKLLSASTFDAVTDWSTHITNGEIVWRYE